jgi:hypothetical protein
MLTERVLNTKENKIYLREVGFRFGVSSDHPTFTESSVPFLSGSVMERKPFTGS